MHNIKRIGMAFDVESPSLSGRKVSSELDAHGFWLSGGVCRESVLQAVLFSHKVGQVQSNFFKLLVLHRIVKLSDAGSCAIGSKAV